MSKDPAFLFYTSDFLTGTAFLTNEQIGKYIRLLCHQHQNGHLKEKDMLKICLTYDEDVFEKFEKDSNGLFFNVRLDEEIHKRKAYSESRRNNRKKKEVKEEDMLIISKTYVEHMENENENEIINKKDNSVFEELYNLYDKKVNRSASEKSFKKIKPSEYDKIRKHIPIFIKTFNDKQFQPYFSTYLNNERWQDEINIKKPITPRLERQATLDE